MGEQEHLAIQQWAIAWMERGDMEPGLRASAIALVPTIPQTKEGMPYCRACESVLCGACGDCHSLDLMPGDGYCRADQDTMGMDCAAWWQAYNAVWTAIHTAGREAK